MDGFGRTMRDYPHAYCAVTVANPVLKTVFLIFIAVIVAVDFASIVVLQPRLLRALVLV